MKMAIFVAGIGIFGILVGTSKLSAGVTEEIETILAQAKPVDPGIVTEKTLTGLPEPVQRWLRFSGIVGREKAITVRLKQQGHFRREQGGKWMPYTAEQYYTTGDPAFIWNARIKAAPLFHLRVRDKYENGRGNMQVKLWSFIPMGNASSPELDQGTLLRYLNEIMWFPSAALSDCITWESINDTTAKAVMEYGGLKESAIFYFDDKGALTNMTANRYMEIDGEFKLRQWSTPIDEYGEFHGIRIPVSGEGVWNLPSGDFAYIRLKITDIDYNIPEVY